MWTGHTRGLTRGATDGALPYNSCRQRAPPRTRGRTQRRKRRKRTLPRKPKNTLPTLPSSWVAWRLRAFFPRWLGNLSGRWEEDVGKVCHERHVYTPKQANRSDLSLGRRAKKKKSISLKALRAERLVAHVFIARWAQLSFPERYRGY